MNYTTADKTLILLILRKIESGETTHLTQHESSLRDCLSRILKNDYSGNSEFAKVLNSNPDALSEAVNLLASQTVSFVQSELERFTKLKSTRPLTSNEKRYGQECLIPLMKSLGDLVGKGQS